MQQFQVQKFAGILTQLSDQLKPHESDGREREEQATVRARVASE